MGKIELHPDFKDFLKLLNSNHVRYLLIGGYAVGYHGYPRATADMDIWIDVDESNANNMLQAFRDFGFPSDRIEKEMFLERNKIIRMGAPPVRIELFTSVSGVDFDECFRDRITIEVDSIPVNLLSLRMLKENKKASGRLKDLDDLEHLPLGNDNTC